MASHIWEIIFTDPVIHRYVCSTCGVKLIVPVTVPDSFKSKEISPIITSGSLERSCSVRRKLCHFEPRMIVMISASFPLWLVTVRLCFGSWPALRDDSVMGNSTLARRKSSRADFMSNHTLRRIKCRQILEGN